MNRLSVPAALFGAAGLFAIHDGVAAPPICLPTPHYRYVGDTASDANCTDNDIQSAIDNVTCPDTVVYVSREHLYTHQHLAIAGKSLTLVGEGDGVHCGSAPVICDPDFGDCSGNPPPSAPLVTLDGSASNDFSVLSITGNSHVTLRYLEIKGAAASGEGGGIHFEGTGSLTLDTSTVDGNRAAYGGGINFNGTGDADHTAILTLGKNTLIVDNTATTSGGGIRLDGHARLAALNSPMEVFYNHAPGGYGGGLEVLAPATADIGAQGLNGSPAISWNDAGYGGGIAVVNDWDVDGARALVRVFTTDPARPAQVSDNSASATGGGIYLRAGAGLGGRDAIMCAYDFRIDDNIAQNGAAIYMDTPTGAFDDPHSGAVYLNNPRAGDETCGQGADAPVALGAVACAAGVDCNTVSGNVAEDAGGHATDGATILQQTAGRIVARGVRMQDNRGTQLLRLFDPLNSSLTNCLLTGNTTTAELLRVDDDDSYHTDHPVAFLDNCTIARNAVGGTATISAARPVSLRDLIIDQPGVPALAYSSDPAILEVLYVLAADWGGLPGSPDTIEGEPSFVDAAHGDFHLMPTSPGVDFAPARGGTDFDGRPRDVDIVAKVNFAGPRDLGAYERQSGLVCDDSADALFCSGFEALP